nr:FAD-dependent monooxygenase [Marinicella sp. W31]MDC2875562.1 FAD-dependent monooxygenase [Marinicella sp. W31]
MKVESLAGRWADDEIAWTPAGPDGEAAEQAPAGIEYSICTGATLAQDRLEPILRARAAELGADVRMSTELRSFNQDADGVTALLHRDGREYTLRADYMIAADGHSSPIRQALGIGQDGRGLLHTVRSVLFRAPLEQYLQSGISQFEIEQPDFAGMLTTYRDGRWLLMFPDEQDQDGPGLVTLIEKAIGRTDLPVEIITTGRWELSALIADRFTSGRVFLAGDAAHTLPRARRLWCQYRHRGCPQPCLENRLRGFGSIEIRTCWIPMMPNAGRSPGFGTDKFSQDRTTAGSRRNRTWKCL